MNERYGPSVENLMRTLPAVLRKNPTFEGLARAAAHLLCERVDEIRTVAVYPRISELPEALLDLLAYDFKVDWWDGDYSLEEKRRTLQSSFAVHRTMGTKAAVETAISAIYPDSKVVEWFEYGGKPYHFRLDVDITKDAGDYTRYAKVLSKVNYYKNLRSHLDAVQYTIRTAPDVVGVGGPLGMRVILPVPEERQTFSFHGALGHVGGMGIHITLTPNEGGEPLGL